MADQTSSFSFAMWFREYAGITSVPPLSVAYSTHQTQPQPRGASCFERESAHLTTEDTSTVPFCKIGQCGTPITGERARENAAYLSGSLSFTKFLREFFSSILCPTNMRLCRGPEHRLRNYGCWLRGQSRRILNPVTRTAH